MKCSFLKIGGVTAIVCGPKRIKGCCKCGAIATRECDWKMRKLPSGRMGTCDRGLCDSCTYSPSPEKDLCPEHREAWAKHPTNAQGQLPL